MRMTRRAGEPRWALPSLAVLLAATAVLYLWDLGASGWANPFYSAAVQAGAESWKAMFFGASDAAGSITVDKPPLALWPMVLTARLFGVGSWSILVPQALMGVAAVWVLFATVRRSLDGQFSRAAATGGALLAGAVLALTPVAALMFRFNNPDALLVLLLVVAVYAMVRAYPEGSTRWLLIAGVCVGLAFLAKMLQAFLVLPVFGLAWLALAPGTWKRRLWQLVLAGIAVLVSAGWWVAIVALVPASSRPYIGGSQNNSVLELTLGYNGLGRLNGDEVGGLGNTNQEAGWARIFDSELGGQISWLVPAALILLAAGIWATRAHTRFGFVLWGGWLLVTGLVFSFMKGIFHAYYAVALAPAVAALIGMGVVALWRRREILAASVAVTAVWTFVLLGRTPDFLPWLRWTIVCGGLAAALLLLVRDRRSLLLGATIALAASLAGPAAYAIDTASTPHTGAIPTAGPSTGGFGGFGGGGGRGGGGRPSGAFQPGQNTSFRPNQDGNSTQDGGFGGPGGFGGGGGGRGGGGLLGASTPSAELTAALKQNASNYTWVAAAIGSNNAAGYQLASAEPVMAIGGFNGTDPSPTLDQFQQYVTEGKIHYFIGGGSLRMGGNATTGSDAAQQISTWVQQHYTAQTIGDTTVYDLTQQSST